MTGNSGATWFGEKIQDNDWWRQGYEANNTVGDSGKDIRSALDAMTAIHWSHRAGALVTFLYIGALAIALMRAAGCLRVGGTLALLLGIQVALGIANVMMTLPMPVAVAHNAGAAALLVMMVVINFTLSRTGSPA